MQIIKSIFLNKHLISRTNSSKDIINNDINKKEY